MFVLIKLWAGETSSLLPWCLIMEKHLSAIAKLLLWPRALTIFDLEIISKNIQGDIKEIVEGDKYPDDIVGLSLALLKPLASSRDTFGFMIHRDSLRRHMIIKKKIVKKLLADGYRNLAEMYAYVAVRIVFYLLTLYLVSAGIQKAFPGTIKIKFEQGSLRVLMDACRDPEFIDMLRELRLKKDLEFSVKSFVEMIKVTINLLPENTRKRLISEIGEFLEEPTDLDSIHHSVQEALESDLPEHIKRRIVESAMYIMGIVIREKFIHEKENAGKLVEMLGSVGNLVKPIVPEYRDILWEVVSILTSITTKIHKGDIDTAVKVLSELGERLLWEKYLNISMSERIAVKAPNDAKSLIPPIVVAPLNLVDVYQYVSLSHIINEIVDSIINVSSELRLILNTLIALDEDTLFDFLIRVSEDPFASLALDFVVGSFSGWLADLTINYLAPKLGARKELIGKIVRVLTRYLDEIYRKTKSLLEVWNDPEYLKKIVCYQLYREYYFLSMRLAVIEDIKKEVPQAKELMSLIEDISKLLDKIYEPIKPKKEEPVDEFIV